MMKVKNSVKVQALIFLVITNHITIDKRHPKPEQFIS